MVVKLMVLVVALVIGVGAVFPQVTSAQVALGPTVRVRALVDEIRKDQDALLEVFLENPGVNSETLNFELNLSVPSGMHVYGQGFGVGGGAGTIKAIFSAPPSAVRTFYLNVKSETAGRKFIQVSGFYYPGERKADFQMISLTTSINVIEPSLDPGVPDLVDSSGTISVDPPASSGGSWWDKSLFYVIASLLGAAIIVFLGRTVVTHTVRS